MDVLHNGRIETRIGDPVPQQDSIFGYILKPFWKSLGLFWCALSAYIQTLARRKALTYIVQPSIAAWTKIAKVFKTTPHFQQEKPHEFAYQQAALIGSTFVNTAVTLTLGNLLGVSASVATGIRNSLFTLNECINTFVSLVSTVTDLIANIFLSIQMVTSNLIMILSLIDYIIQSLSLLQYSMSIFIYTLYGISKSLAKINPSQA